MLFYPKDSLALLVYRQNKLLVTRAH